MGKIFGFMMTKKHPPLNRVPKYDFRNSNLTLNWGWNDNEENYQYNKKHRLNQLKESQYYEVEIEYKFNSDGYRGNEFDPNADITFIGDSMTFGVGLNLEHTFTNIVSKSLNMSYNNLGYPAGAFDTIYRVFSHFLLDKKLKSKYVVLYPTNKSRFEVYKNEDDLIQMNSAIADRSKNLPSLYYRYWANSPNNAYLNKEKNINAIKYLCISNNIKLILCKNREPIDLARDLSHFGIKTNQQIAQEIIEEINNG